METDGEIIGNNKHRNVVVNDNKYDIIMLVIMIIGV
jgi:hypothetical protein